MSKKLVPAICSMLGIGILLAVILSCLPIVVPRLLGYQVYRVVSGSMEPAIPVGSAIYVEKTKPEEIQEGDVIAFESNDSVVAHRVVRNRLVEGEFVTRGDANAGEDPEPVDYGELIGRVVRHFPLLGNLTVLYGSGIGKLYVIFVAICGLMLNLLAGILRKS